MRSWIVLLPFLLLAACDKQSADQSQAQQKGEVAGKVDRSHKGADVPAIPFLGPDGGPATLAQFRGKPLLVNLWATWCAPCVAEMPTLDALAEREKGRIQVVVVSQDLAGKRAVDPFFEKGGYKMLQPYLHKENVLMLALKSQTLPTTIYYDAKGKEQWRVVGAMDWSGEEARALMEEGA